MSTDPVEPVTSADSGEPVQSGRRVLGRTEPGTANQENARDLFRQAWTLMAKEERTTSENELMINSAHASRYYWEEAGTVTNRAIAEWLLSRCYVVLKRPEPAVYHANRCARLVREEEGNTLCQAYAQEALARANALAGNFGAAESALMAAEELATKLPGRDADYLKQELQGMRKAQPAA